MILVVAAVFGWRYLPILLVAATFSTAPEAWLWELRPKGFAFAQCVRQVLIYGVAGLFIEKLLGHELSIGSRRNAMFFIFSVILASLLSSLVAVFNFWHFSFVPNSRLKQIFMYFWAGDATGILMVTPILLALLFHWRERTLGRTFTQFHRQNARTLLITILIPAVVSGASFTLIAHEPAASSYGYLILIPIAWIAAAFGTAFGTLAALTADLFAAGCYSYFGGSVYHPTELQVFFGVAATIGLFLGALRDDQRKAEDRMVAKETEVARLSRLASIGELGTSILHEIATPLQVASTNSQLAIRRLAENDAETYSDIARYQAEVQAAIKRAAGIHRRIRSFAKGTEMQTSPVDLRAAVNDALQLLERDIVRSGVAMSVEGAESSRKAIADAVGLQQVFVNLIQNALAAIRTTGRHDGRVRISFSEDGGKIHASIEDNGTGLPEGGADRVFESFYTTRKDGLGLGLAICKTTLEGFGGHIIAENTPTGARFTVTLPSAGTKS